MFALLTASMFIKGPMVFAFLLPGIVLFQWLAGKRSGADAWCGWWPWIASLALFSVWVICGIKFVPGFYEQVVMKESLGRFSQTVHRPEPVLFYLPHLMHKFAPWSALIIVLGGLSFLARTRSEIPQSIPPGRTRYLVAGLLELGWFCPDVAGFIETRGPHFPGCAATLLVARRARSPGAFE